MKGEGCETEERKGAVFDHGGVSWGAVAKDWDTDRHKAGLHKGGSCNTSALGLSSVASAKVN